MNSTSQVHFEIDRNVDITNTSFFEPAEKVDYFEPLFGNFWYKAGVLILCLITIFGMLGILIIIWFERSGQAGPYRTVVNQLVSLAFVQVQGSNPLTNCNFIKNI